MTPIPPVFLVLATRAHFAKCLPTLFAHPRRHAHRRRREGHFFFPARLSSDPSLINHRKRRKRKTSRAPRGETANEAPMTRFLCPVVPSSTGKRCSRPAEKYAVMGFLRSRLPPPAKATRILGLRRVSTTIRAQGSAGRYAGRYTCVRRLGGA